MKIHEYGKWTLAYLKIPNRKDAYSIIWIEGLLLLPAHDTDYNYWAHVSNGKAFKIWQKRRGGWVRLD